MPFSLTYRGGYAKQIGISLTYPLHKAARPRPLMLDGGGLRFVELGLFYSCRSCSTELNKAMSSVLT